MTRTRRVLIAVLVGLVVWTVFSWPLPRVVFNGIPSSDRNVEMFHARKMIPGDHLQLMYHFWLLSDMLTGKTPFFYNLYEFNTGDDSACFQPDAYYMPFSLLYAAGQAVGGRAFGWNMTGLISIILTFWFTWLLVRRYTDSEAIAGLAAGLGLVLPYRWIPLLTGSPTGFAMTLVPALLLGVDGAVRDGKWRAGMVAGLVILAGYGSDLHVFFFMVLALPAWALVALAAADARPRAGWNLTRLLPVVGFAAMALALHELTSSGFAGTDMADGRTWKEVGHFSPLRRGLFSWENLGVSNHVFFGITTVLVLLVAGVALLAAFRFGRQVRARRVVVFGLCGLGIAGIVALALGVHGPFDGGLVKLLRGIVPRYDMIRQPVKIYCLLPSVLAVTVGIGLGAGMDACSRQRTALCLAALLVGATAVESRFQVSPTICLLEDQQGAYRAVAESARERGETPRALVVPLWPGDSHFTSLYQYYASLYRLRMVNGYSPIIRDHYLREIFAPLESLNQGVITPEQFDLLLECGVNGIIFQEGPFPEKVSPFASFRTLRGFLNNPRLELVERDALAWAFRILPSEREAPPTANWEILAPTRVWEAEHHNGPFGRPFEDATASDGAAVPMLDQPVMFATRGIGTVEDLRLMIRARGKGMLGCRLQVAGHSLGKRIIAVFSEDWKWIGVPLPAEEPFFRCIVKFYSDGGEMDLDTVMLAGGHWPELETPGSEFEIPAACLFHAGYTDSRTGGVVLERDRESHGEIVYGPRMPLSPGTYRLALDVTTAAEPGTLLGGLRIEAREGGDIRVPVVAGQPVSVTFDRESNLPWSCYFEYLRTADLELQRLRLSRVASEPAP